MLVPISLVSRTTPDLSSFSRNLFDTLWIGIEAKDRSVNFWVILSYCPAKKIDETKTLGTWKIIDLAISEKEQIVVMGNWNLHYLTMTDKECLDTVFVLYNSSICTSSIATRMTAQKSASIVYIITVSAIKNGQACTFVSDTLVKGDQKATLSICNSNLSNMCESIKKILFHKSYSKELFCSLVANSDWTDVSTELCRVNVFCFYKDFRKSSVNRWSYESSFHPKRQKLNHFKIKIDIKNHPADIHQN